MSKYIIEIEDVPFSKVRIDADNGAQNINLYRAKGFNALVFDEHGLDKLTSFDKALDETYQRGLDDAWDCAKRIVLLKTHANYHYFTNEELEKIFGYSTSESVFYTNSASEAIEKVKAYEEQQKADAEIVAGDEVKNTLELMNNAVGYFIEPTNNEYYRVLRYVNGKIDIVAWHKENCVKTGKHSDAVVQLLAEMKGKQRNCSTCKHLCVNSIECTECYSSKGYNRWEPKEGVE